MHPAHSTLNRGCMNISSTARTRTVTATTPAETTQMHNATPDEYHKLIFLARIPPRNTAWVIGGVLYTGNDTKVMQKTKEKRSKLSGVERMVNRCIQLVFVA